MTWNNGKMPQFSALQKPSQNPRKHTSVKIKTRWSRHNHQFNLIKTNRYNTLDMNSTEMNKVNIIQPIPKNGMWLFCQHMHILQVWSPSPLSYTLRLVEWGLGKLQVKVCHYDKAKRREQRLLIDLNFPKLDQKQMMDLDILKELPISKFRHTGW